MREYLNISNECNLELMKRYSDNYFDLAIVDPPYGIGIDGGQLGYSKHEKKNWDKEHPPKEYFDELFRVSKNQIIWGFNHFLNMLEPTKAVIFWNKHQNGYFAEGELAWCSIGTVKYYDRAYQKDIGGKIHPTQKPMQLYQWLLTTYAEPNQKILDTHLGSGSIAIALDSVNKIEKLNLTLTACELDTDYYNKAIVRIEEETKWNSLF
jgi:site-specific DNA-methyltransferase (adenine-specific)